MPRTHWFLVGAMIVAQALMLGGFFRLLGEAAGFVVVAMGTRLGVSSEILVIYYVVSTIIAIPIFVLVWRWMHRAGFYEVRTPDRRLIAIAVLLFAASVLVAVVIPSVVIAAVVLVAGMVGRLILIGVAFSVGGEGPRANG